MLYVTKIFRFETAHAIHGYSGLCRNIHGHSYVLHVTVALKNHDGEYLPSTGFVIDFKDLKHLVNKAVVHQLDHQLLLSEDYIRQHPNVNGFENLTVWKVEPTAENILLFIKKSLQVIMPEQVLLHKLKIFETSDSYAEWENEKM